MNCLPMLTTQPFDAQELDRARRMIKKYAGLNLTLADAHGLSIMSARRPRVCWSTDRHMRLGGADLVI
jgi:hypothetical protein